MKIGVVAYEMEGAATGVGRYLEGLLSGLAQHHQPGRWLLFFKGDPFEHPLWSGRDPQQAPVFEPIFDRRPGARPILWEQLRLPKLLRSAGLDLVFSPGYSLPRTGDLPAMVTVHDLSFEHLPHEFSWKERWRRRLLARRAVRQARRVLADTGEIARDLARTYGLDPAKIGVVPLALDPKFLECETRSAESDVERLAVHGIDGPYLLYLGSLLKRRHIDVVIAAFAALAAGDPSLRLVLAGRNRLPRSRDLDGWISGSGCGERILVTGYLGEDLLGPLYRQAALTFYLSSYEGYGLPPLESLAAGVPAIVGPGLALDDLWPEYPYRCQRFEVEAVAAAARAALRDPTPREDFARAARERLGRLTWQRSAELLLAEIERAREP